MKRWLQVLMLGLSLVVLTVPPVAGQEAVELRLKGAPGDAQFLDLRLVVDLVMEVPGLRETSHGETTAREAVRVMEVDSDGTVDLEIALENEKRNIDGRTTEPLSAPENIRVRADGIILELDSGKETGRYYQDLPGRPLRLGETWIRKTKVVQEIALGGMKVTHERTDTFTLESVESGGDRVARIRLRSEGNVLSPWTPLPPLGQMRVRGPIKGVGEIQWSLERGRLVRYEYDETDELIPEIMAPGQTVSGRFTSKISIRRAALPPESVTAPDVSADFLIAPGKGIGAITLDMTAADVTSRLGSPGTTGPDPTMWGADRGFRAVVRNWRGLAGYVDPSDDTKLVALGINDRRYRTAKGLGFGSAYGAALFAHGMKPPRVEMRADTEVTRVLIYDDQGIALGFTADKAHPGGATGPLGSVDWVIVFPPGGAGKVFTLP